MTQPDPTPDDSRPECHPLTPGRPCPGNGTCCDREECDRAIFPCSLADQHAAEIRRLRALVDSLAERCARQSEALSRRAEAAVPSALFEAAVRVMLRSYTPEEFDRLKAAWLPSEYLGACWRPLDTAERIIRRAVACGVREEGSK